jgi:hypothetical protein
MLWKRLLGKGVSHTNSGRELEELDLELLGLWPTMRLILALLEVNDFGLRTQESQSTTCLYLAIAPRATHFCTHSTNVHTSTYTHTHRPHACLCITHNYSYRYHCRYYP